MGVYNEEYVEVEFSDKNGITLYLGSFSKTDLVLFWSESIEHNKISVQDISKEKVIIFKPNEKPAEYICPKEFCFFWREAGDSFAPGLYKNSDEALKHSIPVLETGCGCTFGICIRNEERKGEKDWYEPCEPKLECKGLPWFYFCNLQKLKKKDRQKYEKYFNNKGVQK